MPEVFVEQSTQVVEAGDLGAVMETRVLEPRGVEVCTVAINLGKIIKTQAESLLFKIVSII